MIPQIWINEAHTRVSPYIKTTPVTYDTDHDIYLKWENLQTTGSFKLRGALNRVLSLEPHERQAGIATASAGNHGLGISFAGQLVGTPVIVFVSEHAVPSKVEAIHKLGATIRKVAGGYSEAEKAGIEYALEMKSTWISPYNDVQVIAGQSTLALELLEQLPGLPHSTWVVPVGGGGLISGIGICIKPDQPPSWENQLQKVGKINLIGVQSTASPFMHAHFYKSNLDLVKELPSLADGLAGPIQSNSVTIPLIKKHVDEMVLVNEEQIAHAIGYAWLHYKERIEGSAATALAAILSGIISDRPAVIVLTGGNIQPETHQKIIEKWH